MKKSIWTFENCLIISAAATSGHYNCDHATYLGRGLLWNNSALLVIEPGSLTLMSAFPPPSSPTSSCGGGAGAAGAPPMGATSRVTSSNCCSSMSLSSRMQQQQQQHEPVEQHLKLLAVATAWCSLLGHLPLLTKERLGAGCAANQACQPLLLLLHRLKFMVSLRRRIILGHDAMTPAPAIVSCGTHALWWACAPQPGIQSMELCLFRMIVTRLTACLVPCSGVLCEPQLQCSSRFFQLLQ